MRERKRARRGRKGGETTREQAQREVTRAASSLDIGFVRLWFTDVLGFLKSFAIPVEELDRAFSQGVAFDGSAIEGYARSREEDLIAHPDPFTFQTLPWSPEPRTATMFCDISTPDGRPFAADPRAVLRRQIERAEQMGLHAFIGPEIEFFLFKDDRGVEPLDSGTYFDVTTMDVSNDFRRTVIRYLEELGIPVEESHHEVAASQHEIGLRFSDVLNMADSVMAFRLAVKEAAREFGIYATFMPKPIEGAWGSGMHLHLALQGPDGNALRGDGHAGLSAQGEAFVAGILEHAPAITAVTNQWVNSYKRLIPGYEAPSYVCWGRACRAALVRIPPARDGETRIEIRSPDPACNPYLAFALILGAGLDGIATDAKLPPEAPDELDDMHEREIAALGIGELPGDLQAAVTMMHASPFVRAILGDDVVEWTVRNKLREWQDYRVRVTPYELGRYLATT